METRSVTVVAVSDALGRTASEVARAAAGQFPGADISIVRLPKVDDPAQVERRLGALLARGERVAVYHTIVDAALRARVADLLARLAVPAVDLMGPATGTLAVLFGREPACAPGTIHRTDESYFKRIEAMEYFVEHDDGRGADDLSGADVVLLGVSRTSKTPLSMYLAFQGIKVANIPLAAGMEPPRSVFEVDPARLFGLISTVDVISDIRDRRLGDDLSRTVAGAYADPAAIECEMDEARSLMRRLGCFVVRTDHKAVEESAAEIMARLEAVAAAREKRRKL
ncbi:MAG: kinase/pyrophosphorylase [Coriobacteriaceae bacterium]|nr:kinase/pyrophosphorylase [Coriobacteriaceae bacterium]